MRAFRRTSGSTGRNPSRSSLRLLLPLLAAVAVGLPSRPGHAEAVWDPKEIARLAEEAASTAEQLSHVVELLSTINDLGRTVGRFGDLAQLDFMQFKAPEALAGAAPDMAFLAQAAPEVGNMDFATPTEAATSVRRILALPSNRVPTATELATIRQRLQALLAASGQVGYAVALNTRESIAEGASRTELLASQAEGQEDARGDVGANTAASLAVLEQMVQVRALLASIAEIDALERLSNQEPQREVLAGQ